MLRPVVALLLLAFMASVALAERRVALVIGNGAYTNVAPLANPPRDASAMQAMLRRTGFEVVEMQRDLGSAQLRRTLRDFSDKVQGADIAIVFYAGHGIEVGGVNYLVPIDAALQRDIDVEDEAVPLERVMQLLEPARRLRLVILDACRDNPFIRTMRRTSAGRSVGRGLAKVDVVSADTLVAFAARHGSTAADGETANSPYTTALLAHLPTPGLDLRLALGRVRDAVLRSTSSRQEPFVYGSLGGDEIALVPGRRAPAGPPPVAPAPGAFRILAQSTWDDDCVAGPLPTVRAIAGPRHGTITFGEGPNVISHINGPDKRCLGRSVEARLIYYAPADPTAAADQVTLEVESAAGQRWQWLCNIRVAQRTAQCNLR